ncbi:MAG: preprotein translocase subunit SecG [Verrucomicrobia bacterium]|nr:preprotein translocase subunit SecG [Verrucomicrobiota bacterium]
MSFVAGLLTAVLVLDSLFLILLILVQLPKKEAGVGQAFGGGATDALFGAGTGNALTKMTKYAAGIFLTLCLVLYIMGGQARRSGSGVRDELKKAGAASVLPAKPVVPATLTAPAVALPPKSILTNAPVATSAPAAKAAPATAPALLTATNAAAPKATAPVTTPPSTTPPAKK